MSFLASIAYVGVAVVILALLVDAVRGVSTRPVWRVERDAVAPVAAASPAEPALQPVEVLPVDARHSGFVGLANEAEWKMTA